MASNVTDCAREYYAGTVSSLLPRCSPSAHVSDEVAQLISEMTSSLQACMDAGAFLMRIQRDPCVPFDRSVEMVASASGKESVKVALHHLRIGTQLVQSNQFEYAKKYVERSVEILKRYIKTEAVSLAAALNTLGFIHVSLRKNLPVAIKLLEESVDISQHVNARPCEIAHVLNNLGSAYFRRGKLTEARKTFEESLRLFDSDPQTDEGDRKYAVKNLKAVHLQFQTRAVIHIQRVFRNHVKETRRRLMEKHHAEQRAAFDNMYPTLRQAALYPAYTRWITSQLFCVDQEEGLHRRIHVMAKLPEEVELEPTLRNFNTLTRILELKETCVRFEDALRDCIADESLIANTWTIHARVLNDDEQNARHAIEVAEETTEEMILLRASIRFFGNYSWLALECEMECICMCWLEQYYEFVWGVVMDLYRGYAMQEVESKQQSVLLEESRVRVERVVTTQTSLWFDVHCSAIHEEEEFQFWSIEQNELCERKRILLEAEEVECRQHALYDDEAMALERLIVELEEHTSRVTTELDVLVQHCLDTPLVVEQKVAEEEAIEWNTSIQSIADSVFPWKRVMACVKAEAKQRIVAEKECDDEYIALQIRICNALENSSRVEVEKEWLVEQNSVDRVETAEMESQHSLALLQSQALVLTHRNQWDVLLRKDVFHAALTAMSSVALETHIVQGLRGLQQGLDLHRVRVTGRLLLSTESTLRTRVLNDRMDTLTSVADVRRIKAKMLRKNLTSPANYLKLHKIGNVINVLMKDVMEQEPSQPMALMAERLKEMRERRRAIQNV
eukprot:PhF_6_TR10537/c0_g1_i1/m.16640